ncbi:divalent-cation tolerance protein CutA [Arsenicicoccus dermatophilus]|uniref:divalent-cation tolerance protein CutA n=1 Tax=Arsenicicoccus dermatophilus TaxID=1076331 RepID=UPI00391714F7
MTDAVEIVTTGPADVIARITEQLVEERLIACAHLTPIESVYRWKGKVEHDRETRAAMHTTAALAERVTARAVELHPYEVPCVIVLPLTSGAQAYQEWVAAETRSK